MISLSDNINTLYRPGHTVTVQTYSQEAFIKSMNACSLIHKSGPYINSERVIVFLITSYDMIQLYIVVYLVAFLMGFEDPLSMSWSSQYPLCH